MTFLEQPWQARAGHPGTATPRSWHRTADLPEPDESTPRWYRPAFLVMLAAVAVLYLWDLSASGYANSFYAAAVQAGTENWKAWFFGSLDSSNFITVDKPPASLWVMGLSGRIFGFNSWSLLVPQALEGVAAAGLLCAAVRRAVRGRAGGRAGAAAGLIAGATMALTPAAVLIFRFDNPDAFMVLLVVAAAYCVTRALEHGQTWWLVGAGVAFGFGFLTKSGEAVLNVPAFGLAYLVAAPVSFWRRVRQLLAAALAIVVSAGWWIAAVLLTPAADRPYIGGSTDNNPLELAFGYNGLGRLFGGDGNMTGGGGAAGSSFGGTAGLQRLFSGEFGLEISWLLPAAVVLFAGAVWVTWRGPRTDPARASLIIFGGWLLSTGITFAYMQGTIHPYYTVALAPAIGALVGIGSVLLWRHRAVAPRAAYGVLALTVAVTAGWGFELLRTDTSFHPSVRYLAIAAAVAAVALLAVAAVRTRAGRRLVVATGVLTALAVAVPTAAWAVGTAATPHTGSIPTAVSGSGSAGFGTGTGGGFGGGAPGGGGGPGGSGGGFGGAGRTGSGATGSGATGSGATGSGATGTGAADGAGTLPGDGPGGIGGSGTRGSSGPPSGASGELGDFGDGGASTAGGEAGPTGASGPAGASGATGNERGDLPSGTSRGGFSGGSAGGFGGGSPGGVGTSSALDKALEKATTRWAAAVEGSNSAASLELASGGKAVMAMGGFTGTDPAPTLAEFEQWAKAGDITYYIAGGGMGGGPGGQGSSSQITAWVEAHYKSATIGGETVYLLLQPKS
jgi:4-amino-4-deoxy-L-arabinose transferase-like glycosyltransferase